jgi:hypothetical protein
VPPLDDQFIHRVYRTTAWLTLFLLVACALYWGLSSGLGIAAGSALSLACLWSLERGVRRFIRPGARDYKGLLLHNSLTYPFILAALWGIVHCPYVNLAAVAAGVALPNAVIVLKVLGRNLLTDPDAPNTVSPDLKKQGK